VFEEAQLLELADSVFREDVVVGVKLINASEAAAEDVFVRELDRGAAVSSGAQSSSSTFQPSSSSFLLSAFNDN